ncbi:hypothetical protein ACC691_16895 [Rhizobium johnstonii]|uniref:hypothetical protein n=1 Tax=Rhizobium johnstonii TaxID=3019933 RepID=UPI003F9C1470
MLSSLPKLADRSFILGFLVPSVLFFVAIYLIFGDIPWIAEALKAAMEKDALEAFVWGTVATWLFAIILSILNHSLLRTLEGYLPPFSWIPFFRTRRVTEFRQIHRDLKKHASEWRLEGKSYPADKITIHDALLIESVTRYPSDERFVLPTKFGNAIRAFEEYSRIVYGADAIPLWSHLSSVVSKDFAEELQNARTEVNCLVNVVFLAFATAIMALSRLAHDLPWGGPLSWPSMPGIPFYFFGLAGAALLVCIGAYTLAVDRAMAWGALVKACFDCYLPALATQLGYELPEKAKARKEFWIQISRQSIYHDPVSVDRWKKAASVAKKEADVGGPMQDEEKSDDE